MRIKILRGRRLLCKKPLPRTPSRRAAGVRGDFSAYLVSPAGCGRLPVAWLWSRRLTEPPRPADTRDVGDAEGLKKYAENIVGGGWCGCQAFALFFRRFAPCAVDCTDAGIIRIKILRGRRLLCKKPLPRTPSRRAAGVRGDFSAYLVSPAGCGRLPVAWLWSRRLTEPPRPADTRDVGDAEGLKKYAENIVGGGWCGCQAFALFFRRFAPCAVDCTDAGIMLQ